MRKEKSKKVFFIFRVWYAMLHIIFGGGSIFYYLFLLDHHCGGYLPGEYTISERYFVWCRYIGKRMLGKSITYFEVETEYLNKWRQEFEESIKKVENK